MQQNIMPILVPPVQDPSSTFDPQTKQNFALRDRTGYYNNVRSNYLLRRSENKLSQI